MKFWSVGTTGLNKMVNHPLVRPGVGYPGVEDIDMKEVVSWFPSYVAFSSEIGGMLFHPNYGKGLYESHFFFVPGSGGVAIKETANSMLCLMFTVFEACAIRGYAPRDNRAARVMAYALGYRKISDTEFIDTLGRPSLVYEVRA